MTKLRLLSYKFVFLLLLIAPHVTAGLITGTITLDGNVIPYHRGQSCRSHGRGERGVFSAGGQTPGNPANGGAPAVLVDVSGLNGAPSGKNVLGPTTQGVPTTPLDFNGFFSVYFPLARQLAFRLVGESERRQGGLPAPSEYL